MNAEAVPTSMSFLQVFFLASVGALAAHGLTHVIEALARRIFPDPKATKVEEPPPAPVLRVIPLCDHCGSVCPIKHTVLVTPKGINRHFCTRCSEDLMERMYPDKENGQQ